MLTIISEQEVTSLEIVITACARSQHLNYMYVDYSVNRK